jgi:lipoprotein-anchoring transpeptidase ErfK/SrfK
MSFVKKYIPISVFLSIVSIIIGLNIIRAHVISSVPPIQKNHWLVLHRTSNIEELYFGVAGNKSQSKVLKTFHVKTGIPGERPTPLPQLLGRRYWKIEKKEAQKDNPETAPYFLTLDIPAPETEPYGPTPYTECGGKQCSWVLPGAFGLHGIASNSAKLSIQDPGSSGCIRHSDEDITYLYNLLDPKKEEIRYYIQND